MQNIKPSQLIIAYLSWWGVWFVVQALVLFQLNLNWEIAVVDAGVSNLMLAIAGYITAITYRYYRPGKQSRFQRLAWVVGLSFVFILALRWILTQIFIYDQSYLQFLEASMTLRYTFTMLIIAFMTVLSWLWFYIKEQQETDKRKTDADKLMRDAELLQLRQQLQPHFLFNSLNSISALAGSKPQEARKMIQQLSDFLRGTLKKDENQLVKLSDELQHLSLYLDIEKVRFGNRLNAIIEVKEEVNNLLLPSLLLQPLVENAIKFGLYDTLGEVTINIKCYEQNGYLGVEISNPFDPETAKPRSGAGFGLSSVNRRLYLLYGRQDLLDTNQIEKQYITTIKIPQLK